MAGLIVGVIVCAVVAFFLWPMGAMTALVVGGAFGGTAMLAIEGKISG